MVGLTPKYTNYYLTSINKKVNNESEKIKCFVSISNGVKYI